MVKKRQDDFKKIKLKVGKKLTKGDNVTKTDFKAKKLMIRQPVSFKDDPAKFFAAFKDMTNQGKMLLMTKINQSNIWQNIEFSTTRNISSICSMIQSYDSRVRTEARKSIDQYLTIYTREHRDIKPFITLLLKYITCAITSIDEGISHEARVLLNTIVEKADASFTEKILDVLVPKFVEGSKYDFSDLQLAAQLLKKLSEAEMKSSEEKKPEPFTVHWHEDCHVFVKGPIAVPLAYNISFANGYDDLGDITVKYGLIEKAAIKEVDYFVNRSKHDAVYTFKEAKLFIAAIRVCLILKSPKLDFKMPANINVVGEETGNTRTKAVKSNILCGELINLMSVIRMTN
ncbi:hypothetical protein HDE_03081 [Halotydeus destructor]|nr:hypothetical protein HDE_03081 [Halotydeus destructor]